MNALVDGRQFRAQSILHLAQGVLAACVPVFAPIFVDQRNPCFDKAVRKIYGRF
jgi:hypothetical protein